MTNKNTCCEKCKGSGDFNHTVGSHSDDRGGDSDFPCDCTKNNCFHLATAKKPCPCHTKENMPESLREELIYGLTKEIRTMIRLTNLMDPKSDSEMIGVVLPNLLTYVFNLVTEERAKAVSEAQEEIQVLRIIIGQQACHNYDEARSRGEIKNIEV